MNPGPMPGRDEHELFFDQVVSHFDAPAYVRRGRQVQDAFQDLVDRCAAQRREWLAMPTLRLGHLFALTGDEDRLIPILANVDQVTVLLALQAELRPQLRIAMEPARSERCLCSALRTLCESLDRFNRRWLDHLAKVDLRLVNELRDGYNRYYVLEKECAMRSPVLAWRGFHPLEPLTRDDLQARLPFLPVPRLRDA
jgi:hypothetical protein